MKKGKLVDNEKRSTHSEMEGLAKGMFKKNDSYLKIFHSH